MALHAFLVTRMDDRFVGIVSAATHNGALVKARTYWGSSSDYDYIHWDELLNETQKGIPVFLGD